MAARWRRAAVITLVLAVTTAACQQGDGAPATETPRAGGVATVALNTEPDTLNVARSSLAAAALIASPVLASPYRVTPDRRYEPWLIDGEAELGTDPFTVTYRIREDAVWSDGTPVTARDFAFTWETLTNPDWEIAVRVPADKITDAEVIDDRTVRFAYAEPYAGWRALFSREGVLPAHVLEGEDFNAAWDDDIPVASGPFTVSEWRPGTSLTLARNEAYWGEPALLDEVAFRFVSDTNTVPQALRGAEVDLALVEPAQLEVLADDEELRTSVVPGLNWEFFELRTDAIPEFVRTAIAHGIDRDAIVDTLVRPALDDAEVLDSVVYLSGDGAYEPHFAAYDHDPDRAVGLLEDNGCQREEDGIFACGGDRLDYTYAAVSGSQRATLQFEIVQGQLREVGIAVTAAFDDIPTIVEHMREGTAQLANLSISLGWEPFFRDVLLACDAPIGGSGYCNEEVTELLGQAVRTPEPDAQARLYNQAGERVAADVPVLPLYQVPEVLVWQDHLQGVEHSRTGNLLAGVERWHLAD